MSWANVRAGIVTAIEGLTPGDTTVGGMTFTHFDDQDPDQFQGDRRFIVTMDGPPAQVGQVINGSTWRWLTAFTVRIQYERPRYWEEGDDRMAADAVQIQQTLLQKGNHHANLEGLVPTGDGYADTGVDALDKDGNKVVKLSFLAHHL